MDDQTPATPAFKKCIRCGKEKPLNSHFWCAVPPSRRDEYPEAKVYGDCRQCRRLTRAEKRIGVREEKEKENLERHLLWIAKLKGKQMTAARAAVLGTRQEQVAHIAEIFEALMSMFGGPIGYAESMFSDYVSAKEGSVQRIQLHKVMQSYAAKVSEMGAAKLPVEMMSSEELEKAAQEHERLRLRVLVESGKLHDVIDAPQPTEVRHADTG